MRSALETGNVGMIPQGFAAGDVASGDGACSGDAEVAIGEPTLVGATAVVGVASREVTGVSGAGAPRCDVVVVSRSANAFASVPSEGPATLRGDTTGATMIGRLGPVGGD